MFLLSLTGRILKICYCLNFVCLLYLTSFLMSFLLGGINVCPVALILLYRRSFGSDFCSYFAFVLWLFFYFVPDIKRFWGMFIAFFSCMGVLWVLKAMKKSCFRKVLKGYLPLVKRGDSWDLLLVSVVVWLNGWL